MRIRELALGDYRYVHDMVSGRVGIEKRHVDYEGHQTWHEQQCPDYVADLIVYMLDREDAR